MNHEKTKSYACDGNGWDGNTWKSSLYSLLKDKTRLDIDTETRYENLELCIDSFIDAEVDLDFVIHDLKIGEDVEPDKHPVDERVVANNGKFSLTIADITYLYDAKETKGYVRFHIPKGTEHSLKTLERTKYYVFKGKPQN